MRPLLFLAFLLSAVHAAPPNIILIETDDQRADAIAAAGNGFIRTPSLDRLAKEGALLSNARNQGSYNAAVCIASRSMLLSGQSLWHYHDQLDNRITLGELLRSSGYFTYGTGKWHNGPRALLRNFTAADHITPGFLREGHDSAFEMIAIRDGALARSKNTPPTHSTDLVGKTAVDFLESGGWGGKPFFLYVGFNAPHDPYTPVPQWETAYRDGAGKSTLGNPPAFLNQPPFDPGVLAIRDEVLLPRPLDPAALAEQNSRYYGMISHLDHWVGEILAALEKKNLAGDTIVVLTSDHGLARGSNGLLGKQNLYEHSIRVPLLAKGPGIPAGTRGDRPVYLFELYKTLADFAGATPPEDQAEGTSFRPLLEGREKDFATRSASYHGYTHLMRSVAADGWKLIEYRFNGDRHTQLFDLGSDPHETRDLSTDPASKDRLETLRRIMVEQRDRYGDREKTFWDGIGFGTPLPAG